MKFLLLCLLVGTSAAGIAPLLKSLEAVPGRYIVKLKENAKLEGVLKEVEFHGALDKDIQVTHTFKRVFNGFSAKLGEKLVEKLRKLDAVEYIEEDGIVRIAKVESWGLDRIDEINRTLDDTYTPIGHGSGIHVYVLDTGINEYHEDFGDRAVNAYDAMGGDGVDCNGHGTHCAGTVAGTTFGVANQVKVYGVRVLNCGGSGYTSDIVSACEWVADNGNKPAIGSMSLGGSASSTLDAGVQGMINAGIQVAVAAGNEGTNACNRSPARTSDAITVGATDNQDARAYFSNYGTCVDIFAPGVDIKSAWYDSVDSTNTISGTSMATPHVAGAAAILLGLNTSQTPAQLKENLQIKSTADVVTDEQPGSPNLLLYIGNGTGGGSVPPPPPTSTPCGAQLTVNGSTLTSPNYPNSYGNNQDCKYNVTASSDDLAVGVVFTYFDLEISSTCSYDVLNIYDGSSSSDPLIISLCGNDIPSPVYSTGQKMHLEFSSDFTVAKTGFEANVYFYDADSVPNMPPQEETTPTTSGAPVTTQAPLTCSPTFVNVSGSDISSPGYPSNYDNNMNCPYTAVAAAGDIVELSFNDFQLESSATCAYDKLTVYDGSDSAAPVLGEYCGSTIPSAIYSTSNQMYVEFTTDDSVTYGGFNATFTFMENQKSPHHVPPTTSGSPAATNPPATTQVPTACSPTFVNVSRSDIYSPRYPSDYDNNLDCEYTAVAAAGDIVELSFTHFNLESDSSCAYDKLTVYDGSDSTAIVLGEYCGSTIPSAIYSTSNQMHVKFTTDSSLTYSGFHATFTFMSETEKPPPPTSGCGSVKNGSTGTLLTPNFPSPYPGSLDCGTQVHSDDDTKTVTIRFNSFDVEYDESCTFDYVALYDGPNAQSTELAKLCGSTTPPPYSSTGPDMYIKFKSDASVHSIGVNATYTIN